jgi:hypothetical protein
MALLTLEALYADDGDCLLLHHGTRAEPAHILIDGGRSEVIANALEPRLQELRELRELPFKESLPIALAVLTHVDADHIEGFLTLTDKLVEAADRDEPLPWELQELWFNDFDEVRNNHEAARIQSLAQGGPTEVRAVAANIEQGRRLRVNADRLEIDVNTAFDSGFAARPEDTVVEVPWTDDLKITVLAPTRAGVKALEDEWDRALKELHADKKAPKAKSLVINAASIVLLVESGKRRLLLTGDAFTDDVLDGLRVAGHLDAKHPYVVDVLKLLHHGAKGNNKRELFEQVHARHYVISANGKSGNPDPETLDRLWEARGADCAQWTLHVTFAEDEVPHFAAWHKAHPEARVEYRAKEARGVSIHLGDEHL